MLAGGISPARSRRLHSSKYFFSLATILETVLDEVSFEAGGTSPFSVTIDGEYVRRRLDPVVQNQDLSRFIL